MESTRRGFLGLLAGLVLGANVLGPKTIPPPSPERWRSGRAPRIPEEHFIQLETLTADALRVVAEELEFLRQHRTCYSPSFATFDGVRTYRPGDYPLMGHTVRVRKRQWFVPIGSDWDYPPRDVLRERYVCVPLVGVAMSHQTLSVEELAALPYEQMRDVIARPMALSLAERVVGDVRRRRGAKVLVAAEQRPIEAGLLCDRSVVATSDDLGLSVRGTLSRGRGGAATLSLDMLYGLAE